MKLNLEPISRCRACHSPNLIDLFSLGDQYVVNFIDQPTDLYSAPLDLVLCKDCKLVQLKHSVPRDILYRKYWYKSGINNTMVSILTNLVNEAADLAGVQEDDIVIDIGCNDGTMLRNLKRYCFKVGFEPGLNLVPEARVGTSYVFPTYFDHEPYDAIFWKKAKLVTAIAMFYDLEDPSHFLYSVKRILNPDGIFVIQMNYLLSMLQNNAFDNISHEHLEYYSLVSLEKLLSRHGLEVFDVETNDVNGGSFKIYIKHKDCSKYKVSDRVFKMREGEEKARLDSVTTYIEFANRIEDIKRRSVSFVSEELVKGKTFYAYGASTRGNVVLQYFGLTSKEIKKAAEKNKAKVGLKTVGSWIPIISEEQAREEKPDYFVVLPWQFIEEFKQKERQYLEGGGKFLVFLPRPRIITSKNEIEI